MSRTGIFYTAIIISAAVHLIAVLFYSRPQNPSAQLEPIVQLIKLEIMPKKDTQALVKPVQTKKTEPTKKQEKFEKFQKIAKKIKKNPEIAKKIEKKAPIRIDNETISQKIPLKKHKQELTQNTSLPQIKKPTDSDTRQQSNKMAINTGQSTKQHALIEQQYLEQLIAHIAQYKQYPRLAQRRHIQGQVNVRILLLAEDKIEKLQVKQTGLLAKASIHAVKQALPMPKIPAEIDLPFELDFVMEYRLQ